MMTSLPLRAGSKELDSLATALGAAWCDRTSAAVDWTPDVPEGGQCAVTALVVQDRFGGELIRAVVCGESHYWNRLPHKGDVDLTSGQFETYVLAGSPEVRPREYVLSFEDTRRRYEMLRARVDELL